MNRLPIWLSCLWIACLLLACQRPPAPMGLAPTLAEIVPTTITESMLVNSADCTDSFTTHNLDFATGTRIREINTYESNGAGVAVNDLDDDGDLDIVFASVDRESTILWNQGNLSFTSEALDDLYTRAVNIVDVDGDGALDIAFTHRGLESVSYWHNQGDTAEGARFVRQPLPGVTTYAYTMAWADLNQDGALDLVTGSYNTDLKQQGIEAPEADEQAGIIYYEQRADDFLAYRLDARAEALSIGLLDLNGDHRLDLWVANDFSLQDRIWYYDQQDALPWEPAQPFAQTSHSTMSIEWGDIANDGNLALFTTDMNPYDIAPATLAAWLPMMNAMEKLNTHEAGDPQRMANVLQMPTTNGEWRNQAAQRSVEATGWSWAGKFGDLDQDGFLDLYVVNGMIALNLFGHLPNGELVEENLAFHNVGDGTFAPAPTWNLGSKASGRGMMMADLDNDGDLDIVVNNMRTQAQLFENRLCGGSSLQVDLQWESEPNSHAIGAQLTLHTSQGTYQRDVRAASGYLSGDPARVHFGFPNDADLLDLKIVWPDGTVSQIEQPTANTRLTVTR